MRTPHGTPAPALAEKRCTFIDGDRQCTREASHVRSGYNDGHTLGVRPTQTNEGAEADDLRAAARHLLHDLDAGTDHTATRAALLALVWQPGDAAQAPAPLVTATCSVCYGPGGQLRTCGDGSTFHVCASCEPKAPGAAYAPKVGDLVTVHSPIPWPGVPRGSNAKVTSLRPDDGAVGITYDDYAVGELFAAATNVRPRSAISSEFSRGFEVAREACIKWVDSNCGTMNARTMAGDPTTVDPSSAPPAAPMPGEDCPACDGEKTEGGGPCFLCSGTGKAGATAAACWRKARAEAALSSGSEPEDGARLDWLGDDLQRLEDVSERLEAMPDRTPIRYVIDLIRLEDAEQDEGARDA